MHGVVALAFSSKTTKLLKTWERAVVRLTVKTGSTRIRSSRFTDFQKLKKRGANGSPQFAETTGIRAVKRGFAAAILFRVCRLFESNHT